MRLLLVAVAASVAGVLGVFVALAAVGLAEDEARGLVGHEYG